MKQGTTTSRVLRVLAFAAGAALLASLAVPAIAATLRQGSSTGASAAAGPDPSSMTVTYYDVQEPYYDNGSGIGDNLLRLVNPTAANGSICAFIYVFDDEEEMGACCGCPISPNGVDQISVVNNLLFDWGITSFDQASGVIDVVTGLPNFAIFVPSLGISVPACYPGAPSTPVGNAAGFITHNQAIYVGLPAQDTLPKTTSLTEVPLWDEGAADPAESKYLTSTCNFLLTNGSKTGFCECGDVDSGTVLPVPVTGG